MKPVVGAFQAWGCIVLSVFAIVILCVIAALYQTNHHSMMDSTEGSPEDGKAVAGTVFGAVIVYAVFLVFCGFQAFIHYRENRRGAIRIS